MKELCVLFLAAVAFTIFMSGCATFNKLDPVATGEVIGITYTLTKDQLNDNDRDTIENAYAIFSEVIALYDGHSEFDIKAHILGLVDYRVGDASKRAAVKLIIIMYWDKINVKVNIENMPLADQIEVLKQVKIGIERGLSV